MSQAAAQSKKVSFRAKESTACPICDENHQKEQMFQGGGRLIAGKLAQDLRRLYEKNKKFGRVSPLDYVMTVCPRCLYSSFPKDWNALNPADNEAIRMATDARRSYIEKILGPLDFTQDRQIVLGAASYLLGMDCYQLRGVSVAPTPKKQSVQFALLGISLTYMKSFLILVMIKSETYSIKKPPSFMVIH